MAGTPLYEQTLLGIGIIANPELIEIRHKAPVHTSATTGAKLDDKVGMGCAYALKRTAQS